MDSKSGSCYELRELSKTSPGRTNVPHEESSTIAPSRLLLFFKIGFVGLGLLVTTSVSVLLLLSATKGWTFPESSYDVVAQARASVQLIVQVLSNAFALVWVSVVGILINHASRVHLRNHAVRINTLRLWHSLCSRSLEWSLPLELLLVLGLFVGLTAIPSAIWAGALTPVATTILQQGQITIPAYHNTRNIKEYPAQIDETGPTLRSPLGYFTYSVGVQMQGSLLASASAATPVDGSVRQHQKLDHTRFNYYGRSYGIAASVGLTDLNILNNPLNLNYSYIENGYDTEVRCIHNSTSDLKIKYYGAGLYYDAIGELPNSNPGQQEDSRYVGYNKKAIVAIGVGLNWQSPHRILAIAAGESYSNFDKMQCSLNFKPTTFNVTVGIGDRNITITPVGPGSFETGNLTQVVTRQFELIANDQTNIYVSLVGNSLNASIGDYITSQNLIHTNSTLRLATPVGLANAITAMADDMLVAYASAQLMIAGQSSERKVTITTAAVRVGEDVYIRAVFGINILVIVLVLAEGVRTKLWRRMVEFDYMDPADLILGLGEARQRPHEGRLKVMLTDGRLVSGR